ncbi:TetR/AcrR family transcriptional regulator [Actinomadura gamaensis]|uniref:TetR/AcrR family transcriptional regulator n=1 Tax=Actinomadura gamaensis TaxID=1763541 RepID=A0ABV9TW23_9ACTN
MVEQPSASASREQIRETAARLFADLGYDAVDLKLIADAAGLPAAELVELVGDKTSLYLDVFTWLHQLQQRDLAGALQDFTPDTAGIQGISDAFLDYCLNHPAFVGMWMHRWQGDAADLDVETPFAKPILAAMYEVMAPAVQPGVDLEVAIWNMIWSVHGFVQVGLIDREGHVHGTADPATVARFRAYLHDLIARFT